MQITLRSVVALTLVTHSGAGYGHPSLSRLFASSAVEGAVGCAFVFDEDAAGPLTPTLWIGGDIQSVAGLPVNNVAVWDGNRWKSADSGFQAPVFAFGTFDSDVEGPEAPTLFAVGQFFASGTVITAGIAGWNGAQWESVGGGLWSASSAPGIGTSLCQFDDGTGQALYVGGVFDRAGDIEAHSIARWDGKSWTPVGDGMLGGGNTASVLALAPFDPDGPGPQRSVLVAAGGFDQADGAAAANIAYWDGEKWSELGGGVGDASSGVYALAVRDGPKAAMPELFVGGTFESINGGRPAGRIASWNAARGEWNTFGFGANDFVYALTIFTQDGDARVIAGGKFSEISGVAADRLAAWDGSAWSSLSSIEGGLDGECYALVPFQDLARNQDLLMIGGSFVQAGPHRVPNLASWDGQEWTLFGKGIAGQRVNALKVLGNAEVCAGGQFESAGGADTSNVAAWDGESWRALGAGVDGPVNALEWFDGGGGGEVYAGGSFTSAGGASALRIARWDGSAWSALGAGLSGGAFPAAHSLRAIDLDGGGTGGASLYVGGLFTMAGATPALNLARWDGATWHGVGGGVSGYVLALAEFDDGGGPALYAGGSFFFAGGPAGGPGSVQAANIAKWDGAQWTALNIGVDGAVRALCVFDDDGAGPIAPALYVGGDFTATGAGPASCVARWGGGGWSPVGSGLGGVLSTSCASLAVADVDGPGPMGPALIAGGVFETAGGVAVRNAARWDGSAWSALVEGGAGTDGGVRALAVFDDDGAGGAAPALYLGGAFATAGEYSSVRIARFGAEAGACAGDTNGDNLVNFADLNACLSNFGAAGGATLQQGDVDGDGDVDFADLNVILSNFGTVC